jgi:hypothetical protein
MQFKEDFILFLRDTLKQVPRTEIALGFIVQALLLYIEQTEQVHSVYLVKDVKEELIEGIRTQLMETILTVINCEQQLTAAKGE